MSQLTFNIADYRPVSSPRIRTMHARSQAENKSSFVVLSPARNLREMEATVEPVVEIGHAAQYNHRSTDCCGVYQRRGKVLRFAGSNGSSRLAVMTSVRPVNSGSFDLPPAA